MNLYRQHLVGVQEFEQQREGACGGRRSQHRDGVVTENVPKGAAGEWPCPHDALVSPPVDKFPRFGVGTGFRQLPTEQAREATASPEIVPIERGKQ